MKWSELSEVSCPVARSLSILGDRWTLLIIRNAFMHTHRFDDFQTQLGMTRHLLVERLNRLIEHKIIEKSLYQQLPERYEYKLTERGLALYPVILAFTSWGNEWMNENKQYPVVTYFHKSCSHETGLIMKCQCCGEVLTRANTVPKLN
ncbi:winged helix-turn-helix transcriptional regulator [Acinetobacter sp.]|uniref:winged helix-turn-helix transcriptional regulator n=1 Tax=Acinetobacter sp. TaxID=472 RepID=UPI00388F125D